MFQVRFGLAPLKRISAQPGGDPLRLGRAPGRQLPGRDRAARARNQRADRRQPRDRRARPHPCRQSRACAEDAALRDRQRGERARRRSVGREGARAGRASCATRWRAISSARGIAARATVIGTVTEVAPVVTALARTMEKIHRDRGIAIDIDDAAEARFRGERQDLEEMVGNLVDNACKWAQSRVAIEMVAEQRRGRAGGRPCAIIVDDDGPRPDRRRSASRWRPRGRPARRDQARLRPRPLDRRRARALYGGALTLGTAPIGGLAGGTDAAGGVRRCHPGQDRAVQLSCSMSTSARAFNAASLASGARRCSAVFEGSSLTDAACNCTFLIARSTSASSSC